MISSIRHLNVFSPVKFGDKRVDVIGCGATGSKIALSLAKLGIRNIHIWDFDQVAKENIANQVFGKEYIDWPKVDALADIILKETGYRVVPHNEKVDGTQALGSVIFLLVDSMLGPGSRQDIWQKSIRFKMGVELMIETRMGIDNGRVYVINPMSLKQVKAWESTLKPPKKDSVSACRASTSVGPTSDIISGLAVWQLIRWFSIQNGSDDQLENQIIFSLRSASTFITDYF
jgi:hypothetical protein